MILPRAFYGFSIFLILVLLSLGTWQIQRKTEKEALLTALTQSQKATPQDIDNIQTPSSFQLLFGEGHFVPGKTILLQFKVNQGKTGVYVLDVFQTRKGHFLLIQRGWSPKEIRNPPSETLIVEGYARFPSPPTYFQPRNEPPTYFWIDLKSISQDLNLPLLPYYLVAKASNDPQIIPIDPVRLPPNNHLYYAITWYSLAFSLLIMLLWVRKQSSRKEC